MKDQKYVILCVDDDEDTLAVLRIALEAGGYQMIGALTAEEGLKKAKAEKPDLIIVDLMMEEVDSGASLVMKLRAAGITAPIYILSSLGDHMSDTVDPQKMGVDGVFQKPIDPPVFLNILKTKLSKR